MEEAEFINFIRTAETSFNPEPWYNPEGDSIVCKTSNEATVARRIDAVLTVYESFKDRKRTVGFQIKGITHLLKSAGARELVISFIKDQTNNDIVAISLVPLMLLALQHEPVTIQRTAAYSTLMKAIREPEVRIDPAMYAEMQRGREALVP